MSNGRARSWCWTLNNYTEEEEKSIQDIECKFIGYGREVGESETPHLQGFIQFENAKSFNVVKRLVGSRCHLEQARGRPDQAWAYCQKDGDTWHAGNQPSTPAEQGQMGKEAEQARWKEMLTLARNGELVMLAELHPQDYVRYKRTWESISRDGEEEPTALTVLGNLWIWGPTGSGKSRGVRRLFPDIYTKDLNKWWDNYKGQGTVLLDDVDPESMKYLAKKLKNWADHYPFPAEKKGGSMTIRPDRIIVTSNYEPEACFNVTDLTAINRRFTVIRHEEGDLILE